MLQARTNRIASLCATADNLFHFGWLRDQLFQFVETVATADQNNFIYAIRVLERRDCVRNHRFAAHEREQFVEAHSLAAAGGNDDGAQHGRKSKRRTVNAECRTSDRKPLTSALGARCWALDVFFIRVASALQHSRFCRRPGRRSLLATLS